MYTISDDCSSRKLICSHCFVVILRHTTSHLYVDVIRAEMMPLDVWWALYQQIKYTPVGSTSETGLQPSVRAYLQAIRDIHYQSTSGLFESETLQRHQRTG